MKKTVRKEISKDDYKFFIGRIEKIGNGQFEFIADTQKKAVELLGEKIPQNVIDAENSHKAFNIWLGSEINPIIIGDGGYKEEIHIIGDSYDFFEVKAEKVSTEFKYYLKSNRPLFGAVPSGYIHAEKFENAVRVPRHGYVFGMVIYSKPLTDEQVMTYDLKPDKNNPKADNNSVAVEKVSPSIEKIFAAVTTEIKPHIKGKYFVQIDDNWREQNVRGIFATLEDAVKVARIMYNELCKVSRHIYATVEARTVDINKLWNRADDWTTFYEINSDGEKINRRETIAVIAKIDNRTVEEVRNDICRYGDNYGVYTNSAAEVKIKRQNLTMTITDEPLSAVLDVNLNGQKIIRLYYDLKSKPIIRIYGEISHSVSVWKVPYTGLKYGDRGGHYEREYVTEKMWKTYKNKKPADVMLAQYGLTFKDVEKMFEIGINYLDAVGDIENEMEVDDPVEDAIFEAVGTEIEQTVTAGSSLKAKVAESLNRPRKSIIDWKATFDDMKISEILNLQKDLKKFLKLGQIDLAENVFSMLKTLCKNYRAAA